MNTRSLRDNLALYFRERPNVWIDGVVLEMIPMRPGSDGRLASINSCRRSHAPPHYRS